MNYLLDNKTIFKNRDRGKKSFQPFLLLLIILFLLIFGGLIFRPLSNVFLGSAGGVFLVNTKVGQSFSLTVDFFKTKKSLVHENQDLRNSLRETRQELFAFQMQQESLLGLNSVVPTEIDENFLSPVRVVASPGFLPYDVLLLSFSDTTPLIGQKIQIRDTISLGEIVAVSGSSAKARLYSSAGVTRRVLVGRENIPAVAYGQGGGNFKITLPRVLEIEELTPVFLQSDPSKVIGLVRKVEKTPENPSQIIYVRVPVNIYTLKWVSVYER